jgi:hypothetical protein
MATQDGPPTKIAELPLTAFELPKWLVEPSWRCLTNANGEGRFHPIWMRRVRFYEQFRCDLTFSSSHN